MQKITNLYEEKLRMLIYGNGGTGKTRFAGSAALVEAMSPVCYISKGGNPVSLRSYPKQPEMFELSELTEFDKIYQFFYNGQPQGHELSSTTGMPYKTLIIDGGTEVNRLYMDKIIGYQSTTFGKLPPETEIKHYKQNLDSMSYWARMFYSLTEKSSKLPVHVILTALEREPVMDVRSKANIEAGVKGPSERSLLIRPFFFGQASSLIESYAFLVGRMMLAERVPQRTITQEKLNREKFYTAVAFAPTMEYVAKDQYGLGVELFTDPMMQTIYDRYLAGNQTTNN